MLEALSILLQDEGYEVATASSGMEAVERAGQRLFDLVISDVRMAGMDGIQTLTQLRERCPTTRAILITGYASPDIPIRAIKLGVDDYLVKPFDDRDFLKSVRRSMDTARTQREYEQTLKQQWRDFASVVRLLSTGVEARDPYFEGHSSRVADLSLRVARAMNLPADRQEVLDLAAHLHDIGNIGTKLDIFKKTEKLLNEEVEEIRGSTRKAEDYLKSLTSLRDVFRIILHHHEWFNGAGVPFGLKGEQIPIESRILCAAEAYDAMISPRPYRERLHSQEALQILDKEAGEHFDPDVVGLLKKVIEIRASGAEEDEAPEAAPTQERQIGLVLSLAHTYLQNGNLEIAEKGFKDCLELLGDIRSPNRAEAHIGLALIHLQSGDLEAARADAQRAIEASQGLNDLLVGRSLCAQGLVMAQMGEAEKAAEAFERARKIFENWESHSNIGRVLLLEALAAAGGVSGHVPAESQALVKQRFLTAVEYLTQYDLTDIPSREKTLFASLFVRAYTQGWEKEKLEPFLVGFGSTALSPYLSGLDAAARAQIQAIVSRASSSEKSEAGPPPLSIYAFGKFRVFCGGREVGDENWKTRKSKYLFAYLACQGDRDVPDEKLMELFWPDHDPDKARQNLYSALSHIRKALEGFLPEYDKVVVSHKGFYRINAHVPHTVDVREFDRYYESGSQAARAGNVDEAVGSYQRAEALYQGEFLEGYYSDWALNYRDDYERKYQDILNRLMSHFAEKGRSQVVLDYCQKLLGLDPCDQEAHLNLMRAYVALGKPEQAVRQYQQCCQVLKNELNLSPSPEIASLYLSIKG
jgi:response regulator RpfG family c-di-GMP phosphodiesterase/DNA-binding SARP family transcriptional activator